MNSPGARLVNVGNELIWEVPTKKLMTFSRESRIFQQTHYYANPIMYSFRELQEMADWCHETFGPSGYNPENMYTAWEYQTDPDYIFWFSDEKNLMLFILRWS